MSFKNHNFDRLEIISRRSFILLATKLLAFLLLICRALYLQIFKSKTYQTLSDQNRINISIITPKRGEILDSSGIKIATNTKTFQVILNKRDTDKTLTILNRVFEVLAMEPNTDIIDKIKNAKQNTNIKIFNSIKWNEMVKLQENSYMLEGVSIQEVPIRLYSPYLSLSHILGYMGKINEAEKEALELTHAADLNIGKSGIEKLYESSLRGNFGWKEVESNAFGADIRELSYYQSTNGQNITLTIDSQIQEYIYELCKDLVASVIVSDITNGNIISLISTPSFDNNKITHSSDKNYWKSLIKDPNKPLINRTLQSLYPPGSIFKIVTILAALRYGIETNTTFNCTGKITLGKSSFRCWNHAGHGLLDMKGSLINSCNCYMYNIAKIIGHNYIVQTSRMVGFGEKTYIDLPFEKDGVVADLSWKKRIMGSSWSLGDTYNLAIGQGFLSATPIQISSYINCIATKGSIFEPRLHNNKIITSKTADIPKKYFDFLHEALFDVVNKQSGTAYRSRNFKDSALFSGKTGTSQVMAKKHEKDDLSAISKPWHHRNHGLFIGFNSIKPKHSVSVIVEHGGGGSSSAAPIAQKIFERLAT